MSFQYLIGIFIAWDQGIVFELNIKIPVLFQALRALLGKALSGFPPSN